MKRYILIVYDISDDKKRYKLAKNLLRFGMRTQKSVFEALVTDKELNEIKKLAKKYSSKKDIVTIYLLKEHHYRETVRFGDVEYLTIDDFVI